MIDELSHLYTISNFLIFKYYVWIYFHNIIRRLESWYISTVYTFFLASLYFNSNSESVRLHYCHLVDPSFLLWPFNQQTTWPRDQIHNTGLHRNIQLFICCYCLHFKWKNCRAFKGMRKCKRKGTAPLHRWFSSRVGPGDNAFKVWPLKNFRFTCVKCAALDTPWLKTVFSWRCYQFYSNTALCVPGDKQWAVMLMSSSLPWSPHRLWCIRDHFNGAEVS